MMIRIVAPHFVAGIVPGGKCAPILSYMAGWPTQRIIEYCQRKHWRCELMPLVLVLASCSSPQPAPYVPQPSPPQPTTTTLFKQPAVVPTYSNVNPPKDTMGATLWGPVEKLPSPPTNATSTNGTLNIVIDNPSIRGNVAARGGLGTIVLGYTFKVPVTGNQFSTSYSLQVPRAMNGIAQVVTYFNLHDKANNSNLWIGQIIFDTRCNKTGDASWDGNTKTPIYNVLAPNFTCSTFNDWRQVTFRVGASEIQAAAAAVKSLAKLSPNIGDYVLMHSNINPEAVGATTRIDVGITNWQVGKSP